MSEEAERPSGLTALAIINFVLGGVFLLSGIATLIFLILLYKLDSATPAELAANPNLEPLLEMKEDLEEQGISVSPELIAATGLGIVAWILGIIAGIGYLKMKKFMGRRMGNIFALTGIAAGALGASASSFGILSFIDFVYPALTLVLLNTTFKEDLVR